MPLSQVVTKLETDLGAELGHITDISWDDDGYWEVEYHNAENREVEIRVDPATGEVRQ
ncbi:PepSY domain-containing protein [Paracoccus aerius]